MSSNIRRRLVALPTVASVCALMGLSISMAAHADPPPSPQLLGVGEDMTLIDDWYGSVVVAAPGVTFDCAGHSIIGPGFDNGVEEFGGVQVEPEMGDGTPVEHVTVKNCNIFNHIGGVSVGADHTTLENNNVDGSVRGTGGFGIFSDNNLIVNNSASNVDFDGFLLRGDEFGDPVHGNLLRGNHAQGNVSNFSLEFADNNTLVDNTATGDGESGLGFQVAFSNGNHLKSNTAADVEVGFEAQTSHGNRFAENVVTKAIFGFFFEGSTGNEIEGNLFTEPHEVESTGIFLSVGADENRVEGNYLENLTVGVSLDGASFNTVENNSVLRSSENGFNLLEAHENVIEDNRSQHNLGNGFWIAFSDLNVFENNRANTNGGYGISEYEASNNDYSGNTCGGKKEGRSNPAGLC